MMSKLIPVIAFLFSLAGNLNAIEPNAALRAFSDGFADVAAKIKPSVVTVYSEKTIKLPQFRTPFGDGFPFQYFFDQDDSPRPRHSFPREHQFKQTGMGSGIVIDKDGRVLTNFHVVDGTDEVKVKFPDGATFDASIVGSDPRSDLAVLKIKGQIPAGLPPATLGDSESLRVGEWVLAVGAPFNFTQTVTAGIISAKGRTRIDNDSDKYEDFLQTDAAINPGNSGGPLVNLRGEVIGINTAIISASGQNAGVGFAIPINMAQRVVRQLVKSGKVTRGYLGVVIQDLTPDLAAQFKSTGTRGAVVNQVTKDAPADKAGLKLGDIITHLNGQSVDDTGQLRNRVAGTDPGTKAELTIVRDGKARNLSVTVGELPETGQRPFAKNDGEAQPGRFGIAVQPLPDRAAQGLGVEPGQGVLIDSVENDSPAEEAGIHPGDLIAEVNRERITNVEEFTNAMRKTGGKVLLLIKGKDGSRFVVLSAK